MADGIDLGDELEVFIDKLVQDGRYESRDAVFQEGVRLLQQREVRTAELEASLAEGLADIEAGRFDDIDVVAARLDAKYAAMEKPADAA